MIFLRFGNHSINQVHIVHSVKNEDGSLTVQLTSGNTHTYHGEDAETLARSLGYDDGEAEVEKEEEEV